jgi:hypothetical protein
MARTKGAKDRATRKKPFHRRSTQHPAAAKTATLTAVTQESPPDRPAIPPNEFTAAIAAELQASQPGPPASSPHGDDATACESPGPAASFDPAGLTLDGLAAAWQVPFYALGVGLRWLRVTPDPEPIFAVGRRRAKDLAKPSYPIYEHYMREYLAVNPDDTVGVAAGATALNAIGIVPEIIDAVVKARRKAAAAQPQPQPPVPIPGPLSP